MCVCVCVCVCERERERERDRVQMTEHGVLFSDVAKMINSDKTTDFERFFTKFGLGMV